MRIINSTKEEEDKIIDSFKLLSEAWTKEDRQGDAIATAALVGVIVFPESIYVRVTAVGAYAITWMYSAKSTKLLKQKLAARREDKTEHSNPFTIPVRIATILLLVAIIVGYEAEAAASVLIALNVITALIIFRVESILRTAGRM